jgi:hypothetical protein
MVEKNIRDVTEVGAILREYYVNPEIVLEKANAKESD